jgi:hypothetical protein
MMPPGWTPPGYWDRIVRQANRPFLSGFTGCLGVGAAIIFMIFVLVVVVLVSSH